MDWSAVVEAQRRYFRSGATLSFDFRRLQLEKLRQVVRENEPAIDRALAADLAKPPFEAYASETGFLRAEIDFALKHLASWMRPERVPSPIAILPAKSRIEREPRVSRSSSRHGTSRSNSRSAPGSERSRRGTARS